MNQPTRTLWAALEQIRDLSAIPAVWRELAGNDFPALKNFLEPTSDIAGTVPCSRCACDHDVVKLTDGSLVGVCRCHEIGIHDIDLTPDDITLWQLNWPKLSRALCKALGLASKPHPFGPPNTFQIGTWSADAVPALLTIQWHPNQFRHVVASLVARLQSPFILLTPTGSHMDAQSLEYLANCDAQFFALDSHLILTPNGTFQPRSLPGEIFARFKPEPQEEIDENDARRIFAILERLESSEPPTPLTVLMRYCKEELSAEETAKKCGCCKLTVVRRLKVIRVATGRDPRDLRRLSMHLEKIKNNISDSRAKSINPKTAIYGDGGEDTF